MLAGDGGFSRYAECCEPMDPWRQKPKAMEQGKTAMRLAFSFIVGGLIVGSLAGLVRAGEYPLGLLKQKFMMPEAGAETKTPATPHSAGPHTDQANPMATDPVWDGVVAGHEAYRNRIDPSFDPGVETGWHLFASAGVYYLEPHLESNPGFIFLHRQGTGAATRSFSGIAGLGSEENMAPQVTIGFISDCGWGLRSHWWHFDQASQVLNAFNTDATLNTIIQTPPLVGISGFSSPGTVARAFRVFNDRMSFGSHLDLHVWDSEVTRAFHWAGWELGVSGGVRYGYISQNYQALRVNGGSGVSGTSRVAVTSDLDLVQTGHNLNGVGPTFALEVRRPLWDTGFALYATGRSSVLFGRGRTRSFQATVQNYRITPARGPVQTVNTTRTSGSTLGHDDVLPVEDLEVGIAWSRVVGPMRLVGPVRLLFQTGLVSQGWFDAGNGTSDKGDLSFFGMSLTAGITY
jgi:hypothetical protein